MCSSEVCIICHISFAIIVGLYSVKITTCPGVLLGEAAFTSCSSIFVHLQQCFLKWRCPFTGVELSIESQNVGALLMPLIVLVCCWSISLIRALLFTLPMSVYMHILHTTEMIWGEFIKVAYTDLPSPCLSHSKLKETQCRLKWVIPDSLISLQLKDITELAGLVLTRMELATLVQQPLVIGGKVVWLQLLNGQSCLALLERDRN